MAARSCHPARYSCRVVTINEKAPTYCVFNIARCRCCIHAMVIQYITKLCSLHLLRVILHMHSSCGTYRAACSDISLSRMQIHRSPLPIWVWSVDVSDGVAGMWDTSDVLCQTCRTRPLSVLPRNYSWHGSLGTPPSRILLPSQCRCI